MLWLAAVAASAVPPAGGARGHALFFGSESLTGRIREHHETLPSAVLRCANCHERSRRGNSLAAPSLDAQWLLRARSRRGGPPTVYSEQSFCNALRTGVDPGCIVLAVEMPVYRLDDAQCASLWSYLTRNSRALHAPR
jgi:hypothetical protein